MCHASSTTCSTPPPTPPTPPANRENPRNHRHRREQTTTAAGVMPPSPPPSPTNTDDAWRVVCPAGSNFTKTDGIESRHPSLHPVEPSTSSHPRYQDTILLTVPNTLRYNTPSNESASQVNSTPSACAGGRAAPRSPSSAEAPPSRGPGACPYCGLRPSGTPEPARGCSSREENRRLFPVAFVGERAEPDSQRRKQKRTERGRRRTGG